MGNGIEKMMLSLGLEADKWSLSAKPAPDAGLRRGL